MLLLLNEHGDPSFLFQNLSSYRSRAKFDKNLSAGSISDIHCKIKETLLIRDLNPVLNENVDSEKLLLY